GRAPAPRGGRPARARGVVPLPALAPRDRRGPRALRDGWAAQGRPPPPRGVRRRDRRGRAIVRVDLRGDPGLRRALRRAARPARPHARAPDDRAARPGAPSARPAPADGRRRRAQAPPPSLIQPRSRSIIVWVAYATRVPSSSRISASALAQPDRAWRASVATR